MQPNFRWLRSATRKQLLVAAGYGLVLAIFIGLGWRTDRQLNVEFASQHSVNHAYQMLMELSNLLTDLTNAETGERGFLITGDEQYLEPYTAALNTIHQRRTVLQSLAANNTLLQARLADMAPLIDSKLAELQRTIDLRRSRGFEAAAAEVRTHKGKRWMDQLREQIAQAQADEGARLHQHAVTMRMDRKTLKLLLLLGTIGCVGLLGVLALAVGKDAAETAILNRSFLSRYGMAVAMSGLVSLGLWLLIPVYGGEGLPLVAIGLGVAVAGWWGGLRPGLLTTALCGLFSWWAFVPPLYSFELPDLKEGLRLLITVFSGAVISALAEAMHRANGRLRLAAAQLRDQAELINLAHDAIMVCGTGDQITFWNQGAERTYGWTAAEALGQVAHDLFQTRFPKPLAELRTEVAEKGSWNGELIHTRKDRRVITVASRWVARRDPAGRLLGVLEINRDVTERSQAEVALQASEARLAQANAQLEQKVEERTAELRTTVEDLEHFSYSITHDMRAPLRALRSYAELLLKQCDNCARTERDYLGRIAASAKQMDDLILDALAFAKAARTELPLCPVDPAALLQDMLVTYPDFQTANTDIRIEGALPPVLANSAGLIQCFSNLLNNAVKFVALGVKPQVRISAEVRGDWVRLWFADNGIGISPEFQRHLFSMFQRASHDYAGTGIGLALVRKVTQRMGGQVGAVSEPGHGSRFWIELKGANPS